MATIQPLKLSTSELMAQAEQVDSVETPPGEGRALAEFDQKDKAALNNLSERVASQVRILHILDISCISVQDISHKSLTL